MDADKEYLATARLGVATDTDDADPKAQVLSRASERELFALREADVRAALGRMVGDVLQRPPRFSALKLDGKRLYAQARKARKPAAYEPVLSPGPEVAAQSAAAELADAADAAIEAATAQKTRVVHIAAIEVESMRLSQVGDPPGTLPEVTFRVRCGKGTYIRSLARDLGEALGVGGHLSSLRRLRVGPFDLRGAVHPEDAAQAPRFGLRDAVAHLPQLVLSDADSGRLRNGQPAVLRELVPRLSALPLGPTGDGIAAVAALDERGALIAILQPAPGSTPSDPAGAAGPAASGRPQRWQIARGFSQSSAAAAAPTEEAPCITGCA
jgi:tRNA pseudouridine55 synthase